MQNEKYNVTFNTPRQSVKKWTRPGQLLEFLEEMLESEILGRSVSYFQATWKVREPFHWIPTKIPFKNQVSDDFQLSYEARVCPKG